MLTRNSILSGAYLESFDTLPTEILWSRECIENSLAETMRMRPGPGDLLVFGYGSLIWNPLLKIVGRQPATLHGWHRSFCLRLIAGRGSVRTPGRMLGLEPGGSTRGVAFKLAETGIAEELRLLWIREMPTGAYRPTWTAIRLEDGRRATALAFVADPGHPLYEKDVTVSSVAPLMAAASGPLGSNADYLFKLASALAEDGVRDGYVEALARELKKLSSAKGG